MPSLSCIGLAPAVTLRKPSLIMDCASSVAVVVPSPATSFVLVATSRRSCAPVFSMGSLSSISRTIVTPSLVTVGAPNFFSRTTLRPLGPSVMRTAWATVSMPFLRACLASTSNVTVFAIYTFPSCLFYFLALPFDATIASTSFSDTIRYSMSSTLNSLPAYLAYSTLSPTLSSIGTLVPLSRSLPVPTASTMPSWGFSLAVSGITIPLLVRSSLSTGLSTTRSPSGFRFMCDSPQLNSVSTPRPQALSTRQGRLLILLLPSPREGLNLFGRHSLCAGDQVEGAGRLGVRDHDPGLGEVHGRRVGGIAENLGGDPVRLQDGGDQVGLEPRTRGVAKVAQAVEQRGLEAAEAVLEAGQRRLGQRLPAPVARPREAIQCRPAGVAEPKHACRLVEGFAGRVVPRAADDFETAVLGHPHQVRVRAAHHQAEQRWLEAGARQHRRVDVAPEMVDAGDRPMPCRAQAFGHAHADKQAPGQARPAGDGDQADVFATSVCLLERGFQQVRQPFEVVASRQLRDHAAELAMQIDLGVDDVGQHPAAAFDQSDGGFVAAGFDSEN